MSLLNLPRALTELGRIRLGHKVTASGGKQRPEKLTTFRLTSTSEYLLQVAAGIYGGALQPWADAPGEAPQWELLTDSNSLAIVIPPDRSLSQAWELWSGGGCQRRCDGQREVLTDSPCRCPADPTERRELAAKLKPEACKPVTRLNVMLPDLEGLGVWRLESSGYYAAVELAGTANLLQMAAASGQLIPAVLRLEQRTVKRAGESVKHFGVPVIEIRQRLGDFLAPALAAGTAEAEQLAAAPTRAELASTQQSEAAPPIPPERVSTAPAVSDPSSAAAPTIGGGDRAAAGTHQAINPLDAYKHLCAELGLTPDQAREHLAALEDWPELRAHSWQARIGRHWDAARLTQAREALQAHAASQDGER